MPSSEAQSLAMPAIAEPRMRRSFDSWYQQTRDSPGHENSLHHWFGIGGSGGGRRGFAVVGVGGFGRIPRRRRT